MDEQDIAWIQQAYQGLIDYVTDIQQEVPPSHITVAMSFTMISVMAGNGVTKESMISEFRQIAEDISEGEHNDLIEKTQLLNAKTHSDLRM